MDKFLLLNSPDLMIMSTNLVRNPELSPCSIGLYARMIAGSKKSYTRDYLLWFCNDDENVLNISIKELKKAGYMRSLRESPEPEFEEIKREEPEFE